MLRGKPIAFEKVTKSHSIIVTFISEIKASKLACKSLQDKTQSAMKLHFIFYSWMRNAAEKFQIFIEVRKCISIYCIDHSQELGIDIRRSTTIINLRQLFFDDLSVIGRRFWDLMYNAIVTEIALNQIRQLQQSL
jgi:hypothetical protein